MAANKAGLEVFISYSQKDENFRDTLVTFLTPLELDSIVRIWHDQKLVPGQDWDEEITKKLTSSDIVLLLLSADFLASDYIRIKELKIAFDRHEKREAVVIPIVVRPCPWKRYKKLSELQALPKGGKAISTWENEDEAFNNVFEGIEKAITQINTFLELPQDTQDKTRHSPYPRDIDSVQVIKLIGKPISFVQNARYKVEDDRYGEKIIVDTIHAGDAVPERFLKYFATPESKNWHTWEKDWGANHIAAKLTEKLNLIGFYKVEIARALLDFGRFPGSTSPEKMVQMERHMNRLSINPPFTQLLNYEEKKLLLREYDAMSDALEELVLKAVLRIGIHTYDKENPPHFEHHDTGTERPLASVIYRSLAYQTQAHMPYGLFDPLYPDELGEFTTDPILIDLISLELQRAGIRVAHNFPYSFPSGSIEVRAQVWTFFQYLKGIFIRDKPETKNIKSYENVWRMLLDTNLRDGDSEIYRSFIHKFRTPPKGYEQKCSEALAAYNDIQEFLLKNKSKILNDYGKDKSHFSSLAIEVRKDFVWDFENMEPIDENIEKVTSHFANAINTYFQGYFNDEKPI